MAFVETEGRDEDAEEQWVVGVAEPAGDHPRRVVVGQIIRLTDSCHTRRKRWNFSITLLLIIVLQNLSPIFVEENNWLLSDNNRPEKLSHGATMWMGMKNIMTFLKILLWLK